MIGVMAISAYFQGSVKFTRAGDGMFGLVVLGAGRVVGRRCMPECMTEPEK